MDDEPLVDLTDDKDSSQIVGKNYLPGAVYQISQHDRKIVASSELAVDRCSAGAVVSQ